MLSNQLFKNGLMSENFDDLLNGNSTLITEEYLHKKWVKRHKYLMGFLMLFHILLLIIFLLNHLFKLTILDESLSCKFFIEFKNLIYIWTNIIMLNLYFNFLKRPYSNLDNIFYYQSKLKFILCMYVLPVILLSLKPIPCLTCNHFIFNNLNLFLLGLHLLIEITFVYYYVKCLIDEFKVFSNFK